MFLVSPFEERVETIHWMTVQNQVNTESDITSLSLKHLPDQSSGREPQSNASSHYIGYLNRWDRPPLPNPRPSCFIIIILPYGFAKRSTHAL